MRQSSIKIYTDNYEKEAISFIREHEPPEGYLVGFSGGKDSIVTEKLCSISGVKYQSFFSCTQIDPPEIYKFIKQYYPSIVWLYPKMTFWEGIRKNGVPFFNSRWCCNVLKKDPSRKIPLKHRIMGIRAEESARRANRPRISKFNGQTTYKPIFTWLEWQIWEFIEKYNLPYPSLYDEGFDRIGCIVCPFLHKMEVKTRRNMERWPKTYQVFEKVIKEWWIPQRSQHFQIYEQFLNFWYGFKRF
jgi:phosphoadenosine phosphosulfate reductase